MEELFRLRQEADAYLQTLMDTKASAELQRSQVSAAAEIAELSRAVDKTKDQSYKTLSHMQKEVASKDKTIATLKRQLYETTEVRDRLTHDLQTANDRISNLLAEREAQEREALQKLADLRLQHEQELFILRKFKK